MTDILNGELAQLSGLQVKSHTTAMRYKGTTKSVPEIGRELNVDAVVEGSVQRAGSQVLISVQLIEAATDRHLWQKKFQRDVTDVFKMQSEVTEAIAREIQARLTPQDEARLARMRPVDPQALEAYLQGRQQWNRRTPEGIRNAIALFQRSVELDPAFALGHAGLADAYCLVSAHIDLPPEEAYTKARASAVKALELDDRLAEPHVALGFLLANADWKWRESESEFLQAIALKPNYPPAHYWYAYQLLVKQGRTNEALVHAEKALKLDPVTPTTRQHYAMALISSGRNKEAIEQARTILTLEPDFPLAHWNLLLAHLRLADYSAAIAAGEQFRTRVNLPWVWGELGYACAKAGQKEQALKLLDELKRHPTPVVFEIAEIQAGLGMTQEALGNLELAFTQRSEDLGWLKFLPAFDSLRAEPRFRALLRNVGLEP
jgi:adenylate cyclase